MPLQRRVPKRGFKNLFRTEYTVVSVERLNQFEEGTEVTPQLLLESGVVKKKNVPIKVLSDGTLDKKLVVKLHAASAKAQEKIAAAGGTFEAI